MLLIGALADSDSIDRSIDQGRRRAVIDAFQSLIKAKASRSLYDAAYWSAADGKLREARANGRIVTSQGSITAGSGVNI